MHTHLRMMQKYFMIQRMCSRVMAKNIFNKKSILHSDNGGYGEEIMRHYVIFCVFLPLMDT